MTANGSTAVASRNAGIDVARICTLLLVFPIHAAAVFSGRPYHVKSATSAPFFDNAIAILEVFVMPTFFAIAGWSAAAALERLEPGAFLWARARRLLLPLAVGVLLLCPVIKFWELQGGHDLRPSGALAVPPLTVPFLTFLPHFYTRLTAFTWSHLWFLAYLFVLTVVWFPMLRWIARRRPIAAMATGPGRLPWLLVALAGGCNAVLRPHFPGYWNFYDDWANIALFSLVLLGGAWLRQLHRWSGPIAWWRGASLLVAGAAGIAAHVLWPATTIGDVSSGVAGAAIPYGCLIVASGRMRPAGWLLREATRAVLPVYVLHHVVLLAIARLMIAAGVGSGTAFLTITFGGLAGTVTAYVVMVRALDTVRLLVGGARELARAPALAKE
jgi:Acyltransferase family